MSPMTASKLMSVFVLFACYISAQFGGLAGAIISLFFTIITIPFHFGAWHNKINKW